MQIKRNLEADQRKVVTKETVEAAPKSLIIGED